MKASLWLVALLFTYGCATPEKVEVVEPEAKLTSIAFEPRVDEVEELRLFNGNDGLVLGTTRSAALLVFEMPEGGHTFSTLPSNFGKDFSAIGWEKDDFYFGAIALEQSNGPEDTVRSPEQVVFAMYSQGFADQQGLDDSVNQTVARYTETYGPPTNQVPGRQVQYWFWIRQARWLMVNSCVDHAGKRFVTVALGAPQIMRELRMAPDIARGDQVLAIERLSNGSQ